MSFKVRIKGRDEPVTVEMGDTILASALAVGIPYPHGCQSGNCGACKSELISGDVEMSPYSEYALSEQEREQGLILACRSVPWSDCEVAILDAGDTEVHAVRKLTCEVAELEQATHDIKIMRLKILSGGPFDYSAGQYANVAFEGLPGRDYSMASQPGDELLEFHIRLVPGGAVTPFVSKDLKPGDTVHVEGPFGTAYYRARHRGPILALAGGSGLAPIKSIVEAALADGAQQPITLYFGCRAERDVYLEDHFTALEAEHDNFRFVAVLSDPEGPTARPTGFLHEFVGQEVRDADGCKAYVAGPPAMVEAATGVLKEKGIRRQDVHADAFYTEADKAKLEKAS